jgi:hypothetical protein
MDAAAHQQAPAKDVPLALYHATSGLNAERIAREGLRAHEPEVTGASPPWTWDGDDDPSQHPPANYVWLDADRAWQYACGEHLDDPRV